MKTLICIRQLPYSEPTVGFGGLVAGLEESQITLLSVVAKATDQLLAEKNLEEAKTLLKRPDVVGKVRLGDPLTEILSEARETDYDFIIVGAHEIAGLLDALLGTVTGKVADKARSSVFVIKGNRPAKLQRLLIPIGGQKMNPSVVEIGARLAKKAKATVTVLYVTNPVPTMYTGLDEIEETLSELLHTDTPIARYLRWSAQYLADRGVEAKLEIVQGVASNEIMRVARLGDYDLIVIGAPALTSTFRRFFIDQVTPHVVERSPCSVLVVR